MTPASASWPCVLMGEVRADRRMAKNTTGGGVVAQWSVHLMRAKL